MQQWMEQDKHTLRALTHNGKTNRAAKKQLLVVFITFLTLTAWIRSYGKRTGIGVSVSIQ